MLLRPADQGSLWRVAWTPWRKLADRQFWYEEHGLWLPVCYELALAPPGEPTGPLEVVYTGAAACEHPELQAYIAGGRPLSPRIQAELARDRALFYRACAAADVEAARALAERRAAEGGHPWNGY